MTATVVEGVSYAGYNFVLAHTGLRPELNFGIGPEWTEYLSRLVRHTYGKNLDVKQAVLDALSPFQLVSKLWAADVIVKLAHNHGMRVPSFIYVGSWFGQLAMLVHSHVDSTVVTHNTTSILVDQDVSSMYFAEDCTKGVIPGCDYYPFDVFCDSHDVASNSIPFVPNQMVVWTGIEHFQKDKIERWIDSKKGTPATWLLMGTNRPDYDHINPVNSVSDLEHYFHGGKVVYRGHLSEPSLGNRYMLVCTQ